MPNKIPCPHLLLVAVVALFSATAPAPTLAGETTLEGSSQFEIASSQDILNRLALAERQMALVARISHRSCMIHQGIAVEANLTDLKATHTRLIAVHDGLLNGDPALGLHHGERRAKVIRAAERARAVLNEGFAPALAKVLETGSVPAETEAALFEGDQKIIDAFQIVATEIEAAYVNPFEVRADQALSEKVLNRQEVLVQSMARDVCLATIGRLSPARQAAALQNVGVFEASQHALINGLPGAMSPAPTPEMADALAGISRDWQAMRPNFERALSGQGLTDAEVQDYAQLAETLNQALRAAGNMRAGM